MKQKLGVVVLAAVAFTSFAAPVLADSTACTVTAPEIRLRKSPSMKGKVLVNLKKNTQVTAEGKCSGGWVKVVSGSRTGYVGGWALQDAAPKIAEAKVAPANIEKAKTETLAPANIEKAKAQTVAPAKVEKAKAETAVPAKIEKAKAETAAPAKVENAKAETAAPLRVATVKAAKVEPAKVQPVMVPAAKEVPTNEQLAIQITNLRLQVLTLDRTVQNVQKEVKNIKTTLARNGHGKHVAANGKGNKHKAKKG